MQKDQRNTYQGNLMDFSRRSVLSSSCLLLIPLLSKYARKAATKECFKYKIVPLGPANITNCYADARRKNIRTPNMYGSCFEIGKSQYTIEGFHFEINERGAWIPKETEQNLKLYGTNDFVRVRSYGSVYKNGAPISFGIRESFVSCNDCIGVVEEV